MAIGLVHDYARGLACSRTVSSRQRLTQLLTKWVHQHQLDAKLVNYTNMHVYYASFGQPVCREALLSGMWSLWRG